MSPFGDLELLNLTMDSAFERGRMHGERLRAGVLKMAEIRLELMLNDTDFKSEGEVMALAGEHLPLLKHFDKSLYEELQGIAAGAGITPELVVVINHYTDMRDIRKAAPIEGGCSVIFAPTPDGPILGQTWDVHGSATEHVFMMQLSDQLVLSVAGCLGMTGINKNGVAITINNLNSLDAKVGIVWPALVRKVLKAKSAQAGRDIVMEAPLGSGHHYVMADATDLFAIETSGTKKKITQSTSQVPHIHTNHCLDDEMRHTHTVRKTSTTFERFAGLEAILSDTPLNSAGDVYEALGRVSMPMNTQALGQVATCGTMVMDIANRSVLACKGPSSQRYFQNQPISFKVDAK